MPTALHTAPSGPASPEDHGPPGRVDGGGERPDDLAVGIAAEGQGVLGEGLAVGGDGVAVEQARLQQFPVTTARRRAVEVGQ